MGLSDPPLCHPLPIDDRMDSETEAGSSFRPAFALARMKHIIVRSQKGTPVGRWTLSLQLAYSKPARLTSMGAETNETPGDIAASR